MTARIHIAWSRRIASRPGDAASPSARIGARLPDQHSVGLHALAGLVAKKGLAQKLSGDTLPDVFPSTTDPTRPDSRHPQAREFASGLVPHVDTQNAARGLHSLALAAADALYDNYASYGIRNVLKHNPDTLPRITAGLDAKLGL